MNKINWVQKLSSRKFWAALIGLVVCIVAFTHCDQGTTEKIVALVGAIGSMVMYMLSETIVDAAREENRIDGDKTE
ncbi:MAG: hypothetical protein PUG50_04450 [Eubacteriales bacterium]|uniref:hypothetical protein n=1 Tax=Fenollaria sp. TaxID=1965292 RepID=UPI002A755FEA|nr:hypothetical protein [Fenollaria sp.]MDD7339809.1 hypothetical protein [Eubacteriales bacterium]MDY3106295.1 hypothetical protein [Fenollaria sp.]